MDIINIVKKLNILEKLVKELLCNIGKATETDPTVPDYIKNLKEEEIKDITTKINTKLGTWT